MFLSWVEKNLGMMVYLTDFHSVEEVGYIAIRISTTV